MARRPNAARPLGIAGVVLVVVGLVLGLAAAPASAHAVVVSSSPGDRESLIDPPSEVSITFSEAVDLRLGGLTVLGTDGQPVDDGNVTQPTPEQAVVGLRPDLADGTYIVNYRVVSADGHPIGGSLVFAVGTAVDEGSAEGVQLAGDPAMQIAAGVARFVAYLGAFLAAGSAFYTWFVHDRVSQNGALVRLVLWSAGIGVVGLLALVTTQAALATGSGPGAVLDPDTFADTVTGNLGWSVLTVLIGLAVAAGAMYQRHEPAGQVAGFCGLVGVGVGFALWGHGAESADRWLTLAADSVHGAAAGLWFGGLVALSIVLVARLRSARVGADETGGADESDGSGVDPVEVDAPGGVVDTVGVVVRFSTMATIAVTLLALGGVALAWVELGGPGGLVESSYGRVLLVKLAAAAVVAVLAVLNHLRLLPAVLAEDREPATDDPGPWRRLSSYVRFEAIGLAAVLGLTAVLVGITPPTASTTTGVTAGPFNETKAVAGGQLNMVLTPALVGTNAVHLQYQNAGRPADIAALVTVELSLPEVGVGPIERTPVKAGVGHWIINATDDLSIAGTWQVDVVTRISEFEQERTTFQVPIGE